MRRSAICEENRACPALLRKLSCSDFRKTMVLFARPASQRGANASSRSWGGMRWTLIASFDERCETRTEKAWCSHPWAGAQFAGDEPAGEVTKRVMDTWGGPDTSNTIAQGMSMSRCPVPPSPMCRLQTRSPILTILWHCDWRPFSSRTALARASGNKPSTVLAEHHAAQGSGNADWRPNRWDFRDGGRSRRRSCVPGCVAAHPARRRASPSYLPLRAGWAICAWALRGCARSTNPSSAQMKRSSKRVSS